MVKSVKNIPAQVQTTKVSFKEMVFDALKSNDRKGSSFLSIKKFIEGKYQTDFSTNNTAKFQVRRVLLASIENGSIKKTKGTATGLNGKIRFLPQIS